ncbi:hypothetical protein N136_01847, partial [Leifsonia aquatica ATCC 14665]
LARDGAEQVGRALQPLLSTVDGTGRAALTRELERMLSAH